MAVTITAVSKCQVSISTPRLILRGAQVDDEIDLHSAFANPEVMRYWSSLPHKTVEETKTWVDKMSDSSNNGLTDFIICLKPDLTPVGKIGIWSGNEVGFMLAQEYWGKGLASEALAAVIPYFFSKKFEFDAIIADVDPRNAASIGILRKMGFEEYDFKERTLEVGGEWVDSTYLKLTRDCWENLGGETGGSDTQYPLVMPKKES